MRGACAVALQVNPEADLGRFRDHGSSRGSLNVLLTSQRRSNLHHEENGRSSGERRQSAETETVMLMVELEVGKLGSTKRK